MKPSVNICRPGFGASCALCCGSHNYNADYEDINSLFYERSLRIRDFNRDYIIRHMNSSRSSMTGSYYYPGSSPFIVTLPAKEVGSRQCPFVGYSDKVMDAGCLLYHDKIGYGNSVDCFQNYHNKVFSCDAGEKLAGEEIIFAAKLFRDWYFYSMLIHSYDYLFDLMGKFTKPDEVPHDDLYQIKNDLLVLFGSSGRYLKMESYFS